MQTSSSRWLFGGILLCVAQTVIAKEEAEEKILRRALFGGTNKNFGWPDLKRTRHFWA